MHVPFLMSCGHSSCYLCLLSWFKIKMNCPTCRKESEEKPFLNLPLRHINKYISDVIIDATIDEQEKEKLIKHREQCELEYQRDFELKSLFGKLFESTLTLIDRSDGVPRCGNCHWEAHGSVCLHCGTRFRIPRDDDYYDSEDGDAYNEDAEELNNDEEDQTNEYDTADSFVDDGEPIVYSDVDDNLNISPEEWEGFEEGSNASQSGEEGSSVGDEYSVDLHRALDNFHNDLMADHELMGISDTEDSNNDDISSDDTAKIISRRSRVISVSDDEEE